MTVGVAAITEYESDEPKVLLSADRLLTTLQESAIEHEYPETKLTEVVPRLNGVHVLAVFSGGVSLAEDLAQMVDASVYRFVDEEAGDDQYVGVQAVAELAAEQYRQLVRDKIEKLVLSSYGLTLEDMGRQHQFKDGFFNDIWSQVNQVEHEIVENLNMLIGGVDQLGAHVYEVGNNDVTGHNQIGYAAIGSGRQPAKSEFIKEEYGKSKDFDTALATITASTVQAQRASGVGGDLDIGLVTPEGATFASSDLVERLTDRQEDIEDEQAGAKQNILESETIHWEERDED
jgi:hypothetical protein